MIALTSSQIATLTAAGNSAHDWQQVRVGEQFDASAIRGCRFEGVVEIETGVTLINSTICNYHICSGTSICDTLRLECRHSSSFGNGTRVATVNENGGRMVTIYNDLTAQVAYIAAMYRHRTDIVAAITRHAEQYAAAEHKNIGTIGNNCTIIGARFIREVNMANNVVVEGASLLEDATLLEGAYIGIDVKASHFIAAQDSTIDSGAIVERAFVGERAVVAKGFTAIDSLLFAATHLENGEACSIFAGPYTVSHHKSSLLIAGIFSFFNAGSGTNQSNHLFKSGAVHQAVHRRGCKFGSNGYVMAPADEGEFTVVIGRHTKHHDTSALPFSYLIENNGTSTLLPAFALRSYGTVRDIAKWRERDTRRFFRDNISYNEYNPYLTAKALAAVALLEQLLQGGDSQELHHRNTTIKRSLAQRGIALYKSYIAAALGSMLATGSRTDDHSEQWVDLAGQYVPQQHLEQQLDNFTTTEALEALLSELHRNYDNLAHTWAVETLSAQLGHDATDEDIAAAIAAGKQAQSSLRSITDADRIADTALTMSIGYGIDSKSEAIRLADFAAVQHLE